MGNEISPELIRKYINKTCTPEEVRLVEDWYSSFEGEADPLAGISNQQRQQIQHEMFDGILENIQTSEKIEKPASGKIRIFYYALTGIAATILLVVGMKWFASQSINQADLNQEVVFENTTKSIRRQVLSDGSVVWLQPKTSIRYPKQFYGKLREVRLKGEAFFEVTKDPAHPFIVYSREVVTKVLGTSFNIKAFDNMPSIEVAVVTGKVTVGIANQVSAKKNDSSTQNEVTLLPEQKAVFLENKHALEKQEISDGRVNDVRIWEKTTVSFDNIPLKTVARTLEKEFDVSIRLEPQQLNDYVLRADFSGQNLADILEMLEKSLNVSYKIQEKQITIKSKNN